MIKACIRGYSYPKSVADLKISASGHEKACTKGLLPPEICGNIVLHRPRDMSSACSRRYPNMPAPLSDLYAQKKKDAADSTLSAAFWRSGSRCILLFLCYNTRSAGQICCSRFAYLFSLIDCLYSTGLIPSFFLNTRLKYCCDV